MGIRRVVIPHHASVFSAEGLLLSDYSRSSVQTVNWNLAKGNISELNTVFDTLSQQVTASLQDNGFSAGDIDLTWEGDFKFGTQVYELTILIPHKELTEEDKALLAQRFIAEYERLYGQGASWENAENLIVILNLRVTGVGRTAKPGFVAGTLGGSDASDASIGNRQIFLPDRETEESVSIFRDERFLPGMRISGPAVIEARDTTIYVPYGVEAEMDVYRNYSLTLA
jgi:N-methylhydantoinase A